MLVLTPQPNERESVGGYLVRLTEANGYSSTSYLRALIGQAPSCGPVSAEDLIALTGMRRETAERMCTNGDNESSRKLLTKTLGRNDIVGKLSRICVSCVSENGYCDAFWELSCAWACPDHREWFATECGACARGISHQRARVAYCTCGEKFASPHREEVPEAVIEMMSTLREILYCQDLAAPPFVGKPSDLPLKELIRLMRCLRTVATMDRAFVAGFASTSITLDQIGAVCSALADWPAGFHAMLECRYGEELEHTHLPSASKILGWATKALRDGPTGDELTFLAVEAARFGARYWAVPHLKMFRNHLPEDLAPRWILLSEAAAVLKMSSVTLGKLVAGGGIESRTYGPIGSATDRIAIRTEWVDAQVLSDHPIVGIRKASQILGLPSGTLKLLRQSGHFPSRHLTNKPKFMAMEDVVDLQQRIAALGKGLNESSDPNAITIRAIRDHYKFGHEELARVISSLLDCPEQILGRQGAGFDDLQISNQHEFAYAPGVRSDREQWVSQDHAAKRLGCSTPMVQALLDNGFIARRREMAKGTVCTESLKRFSHRYTPLTVISKELGVYSRTLTSLARKHAIPLIVVPGATRAVLVPRKQVSRLMKNYAASLEAHA